MMSFLLNLPVGSLARGISWRPKLSERVIWKYRDQGLAQTAPLVLTLVLWHDVLVHTPLPRFC